MFTCAKILTCVSCMQVAMNLLLDTVSLLESSYNHDEMNPIPFADPANNMNVRQYEFATFFSFIEA